MIDNTLNIDELSFLICSHIIVADAEIHTNQINLQKSLFQCSEKAYIEHNKILSDDKDKIQIDNLLSSFRKKASKKESEKLILSLFKFVYADGFYHHKEREFIDKVINVLSIPSEEIDIIENKVVNSLNDKYIDKKQNFWESAKESFNKIAYNITGSEKFEGGLLDGKEFVNKIREIGNRAKFDLDIAQDCIQKLDNVLVENYEILQKSIQTLDKNKRNDKESEQITSLTNNLNQRLGEDIGKMLRTNIEMLNKKRRTIDYFTIAFMGRTKAGKSTFHKVVTGEETDDIGVGKLRTTRYNRVFNWENIRIIDTPGIGAPGGATDTETARMIVDEADLICYVVTNDAIQETEFRFLSELKEKNKPIFIILNCKNNLEHKLRLKRFLDNPFHWKEDTGDKSIKGHIDRIHEMIEKYNYSSDFIEIIPMQLLAAQMSINKNGEFSADEIKKLQKGSNIDEYTKKVKQTIFRSGHLKKSQNILDGTNYYVVQILDEVGEKKEEFKQLLNTLKNKKKQLNDTIVKEKKITLKNLKELVSNTHRQIKGGLRGDFVNEYYESKNIGKDWEKFVKQRRYYDILQAEIGVETNNFSKRIKDKVEEVFEDISMVMQYSFNVNIQGENTTNYKGIFAIGVSGVLATMTALAFVNIWNPAGWVFIAVSVLGGLIGSLFDSKAKKIERAKNKLIENIDPNIDQQEKEVINQVVNSFEQSLKDVERQLNSKFDNLIKSISEIVEILTSIQKESQKVHNELNKYFVFRIFEHHNLIKSVEKFEKEDMKIKRSYKNNLLSIQSSIKPNENQKVEIKKLLQTQLEIK